ncbi:hypothetical protein F511_36922 [Dorcoceras hygrometricum]|uniref:Uncharacterized protein n=1 Tax=Dorcoceras hygrometricum TaxID=472368 RepID=A0A2Z7BXY5_9LAMI|nr:hypothetical protein F511_36922 [Dorcoceras hygrometricum]
MNKGCRRADMKRAKSNKAAKQLLLKDTRYKFVEAFTTTIPLCPTDRFAQEALYQERKLEAVEGARVCAQEQSENKTECTTQQREVSKVCTLRWQLVCKLVVCPGVAGAQTVSFKEISRSTVQPWEDIEKPAYREALPSV